MASPGARALALAALVLTACSGAAGSELFAPGDPNDTSPTDPAPSATTPDPTPPVPDAGPPEPPPVVPDAGRPDAEPPVPTCTQEAEPDNDLSHATVFTASLCGKIDSASDVDFGKFVVPLNAKSLAITHEEKGGKVSYRYYRNGQQLQASDALDAIPGATYSVQIRLANGNPNDRPTYQLNVSFK
ncbi:MAG TPA: hypothetical protein VLT33_26080 [Labilithrix sp.]|nr:hypothetical protein [Labilithrix sp.]